MVEAATEFRKSGFSDDESATLARVATMYQNVADEAITAGESASFIIAQMKAFNITADDSQHIIDAINEVSNNFAVSSSDLAGTLGIVSANMANVGNSYEQTLGMMTAITEVTRNSSKAARGLNSITSRLIQTLDSESSTGKKLIEIYDGLGIALFDQQGQLRNSFDIFRELSQVWGTLSTNEREYIALTSAGANQVQNFTALMSNFDVAVRATDTAIHSQNSAMEENEAVMDSLDARTNLLKATFQDLANNVITNEMIKAFLELANVILQLVNNPLGVAIIRFGLITGVLTGFLSIVGTVGSKIVGLANNLFTLGTAATAAGTGAKAMGAGFLAAHPAILAVAAAIGVAFAAISGIVEGIEADRQATEEYYTDLQSWVGDTKAELERLNTIPETDRSEQWYKDRDALIARNEKLEETIRLLKEERDIENGNVDVSHDARGRIEDSNVLRVTPFLSGQMSGDQMRNMTDQAAEYWNAWQNGAVEASDYVVEMTSQSGYWTTELYKNYGKQAGINFQDGLKKSLEDRSWNFSDTPTTERFIEGFDSAILRTYDDIIRLAKASGIVDNDWSGTLSDLNDKLDQYGLHIETIVDESTLIGKIFTQYGTEDFGKGIIETFTGIQKSVMGLDDDMEANSGAYKKYRAQIEELLPSMYAYQAQLQSQADAGVELSTQEKEYLDYMANFTPIIGTVTEKLYDEENALNRLTDGLTINQAQLAALNKLYPNFNNYVDTSNGVVKLSAEKLYNAAAAGDTFALSLLKVGAAANAAKIAELNTQIQDFQNQLSAGTNINEHTEKLLIGQILDAQSQVRKLSSLSEDNINAFQYWLDVYNNLGKGDGVVTGGTGGSKTKKDPIQEQYNAYKKLLDAQKEVISLRKKEGASDEELISLWSQLSTEAGNYATQLQQKFNLPADNNYFVKLRTSMLDFQTEVKNIKKENLNDLLDSLTGKISYYEQNGWQGLDEQHNSAVKLWRLHIQALDDAYNEGILTEKEYVEKFESAQQSLTTALKKEWTDRLALSKEYISQRNKWEDWDKFKDPRDNSTDTEVKAWERTIENLNQAFENGIIGAEEYYSTLDELKLSLRDARRSELDKEIENVEEFISERNSLNDWGNDNELKQYANLMATIDQYWKQGNVDYEYAMKQRQAITKKYNEALKDATEKALDDISAMYDKMATDAKDHADDYKSDVQDLVDVAQARLEDIQDQLDDIDKKWDAEIEALDKANEELDKQIQKEEALNDLAKARSKKVLVYKDGRFQYIQDADEISAAQKKLEDIRRQEELQAQKDAIEEKRKNEKKDLEAEKAYLEKYIKYWDKLVRDYDIDVKKANAISKKLWDGQSKDWEQGLKDLDTYIAEFKKRMDEYNDIVNSQQHWNTDIIPNLPEDDKITQLEEAFNEAYKNNNKELVNSLGNELLGAYSNEFFKANSEWDRYQRNKEANAIREKMGIYNSSLHDYAVHWDEVLAESQAALNKTSNPDLIAEYQKRIQKAQQELGISNQSTYRNPPKVEHEVLGPPPLESDVASTPSSSKSGSGSGSGKFSTQKTVRDMTKTAATAAAVVGSVVPKVVSGPMGMIGAGVAAIGGLIGGLFKGSKKNAHGTYSSIGGMSLVGEDGPELRVLSKGDGVIPSNMTKNLYEWGKTTPKDFMAGIPMQNEDVSKIMSITIQNLNLPSVQDGEDFVKYMQDNFWTTTIQQLASRS